jgi:hypothetical protein
MRQKRLELGAAAGPTSCRVVPVGKRRDGGTRYWCLFHRADATAKYGRPANRCRYADVPPISEADTRTVNIDDFPGGVAVWGAVPPVYDTTRFPLVCGIHLHARRDVGGPKALDETCRSVRLTGAGVPPGGVSVSDLDAVYYMVSSVFGYPMRHVACTYCQHPHLDKDYFSVHPHRRHLCAGCGRHFSDSEVAVGNPSSRLRGLIKVGSDRLVRASRRLTIRQGEFPGGIQIWGSNQALVWTSTKPEEEGIHVHAFREDGTPAHNDTFAEVTIDGVSLDAQMVRVLMAQSALPHVWHRVVSSTCPGCGMSQFDAGTDAFTPRVARSCTACGRSVASRGRLRKTIANPLVAALSGLAAYAPRAPQRHDLGLIPETLGPS